MKIDRVTLQQVRMSLITPFAASSHKTQELNHILVKLEGEGVVGWGESSTLNDPYYLGETVETAWHILKDFLAPSVVGKTWSRIDEFAGFYGLVKGNTFARAGIEVAAFDMLARAEGRPLSALLGGGRRAIASGVSLGIEREHAQLLAHIEKHLAEGYRRVKIKVAPGHDLAVLDAVRSRFPDVPLMVDANSAYTLDDVAHLKDFDRFDLMMIEQPLAWDDIIDHAVLQRAIETPVCLDESIRTVDHARHALDLGSCRVINVKVARVGGLREAKRIHDLCHARGVPVWCGGMHDFGVGRAANIALASLPGFSLPGDISGSDKYFARDIIDPPVVAVDGMIEVPTGPGLGYETREDRIRDHLVRETVIGAG